MLFGTSTPVESISLRPSSTEIFNLTTSLFERKNLRSLHILHSEAATGWGGQEIRIFQETRLLLERDHQVSIICQPGSPLEEQCRKLSHPRLKSYPVRMARTLDLTAFRAIHKIIKDISPNILHTHSSIDSWLVSFCGKLLKIPIVRSRHVSIPVKNFFPRNLVYSHFPDRIITSGTAISEIGRAHV